MFDRDVYFSTCNYNSVFNNVTFNKMRAIKVRFLFSLVRTFIRVFYLPS